ncbi:MAG: DUF4013 domain-containing protein [Anaerolineae bacterium]
MDIGKSVTYAFEDPDWVTKLLIGGVVNLVPIVNLAALGYQLRTLRRVAANEERPLPDWHGFGDYLVKGLIIVAAGLIYALPIALLAIIALIVSAASGSASSDAAGIVALCWSGVACFAVLYGIVVALWFPAALALYAVHGEFAAFFRFGEIWAFISRNLGGYVVVLLVVWVVGLVAATIGNIVPIVGAAFAGFWAMLVYAHLFGQLMRENGLAPATI